MENIMVWIWLAVTVIAIVVEIITPELVSLWFAIGGIVGIAFSFIPGLTDRWAPSRPTCPGGARLLFSPCCL